MTDGVNLVYALNSNNNTVIDVSKLAVSSYFLQACAMYG